MSSDESRLIKFIETLSSEHVESFTKEPKTITVTNSNGMDEWDSIVEISVCNLRFSYTGVSGTVLVVDLEFSLYSSNYVDIRKVTAQAGQYIEVITHTKFSDDFYKRLGLLAINVRSRDATSNLIDAIGGLPNGM